MSTTGPTTDERLRSGLDSNQQDRERMCLALLPLLGNYRFPDPRRPRGGPDGGRDIEAVYDEGLRVWGAVGFQNGANDSNENKKWVSKKFKSDLDAAIKKNKNLRGYVFFTNVDLTPGEQTVLQKFATKKGLTHVQVFGRERLRAVLDSTEGLGYRLEFLSLPMSTEQQLQFIKRFGDDFTDALQKHREGLEHRMSGPLGCYLMAAAVVLLLRGYARVSEQKSRAVDMNDKVIEQKLLAEQFRAMQEQQGI